MKQLRQFAVISVLIFIASTQSFGQTQSELNQQSGSGYKQAEAELNKIYQQILKEYSADTSFISHLKAAERLWIKFRDAELLMKYPPQETGYYGSALPMCQASYLEKLTRDRIKTLKVWVEGIEEGDICSGSVKNK